MKYRQRSAGAGVRHTLSRILRVRRGTKSRGNETKGTENRRKEYGDEGHFYGRVKVELYAMFVGRLKRAYMMFVKRVLRRL